MIHNAGISRNTTFDGIDDEHWFPVIETHLLGGFYLARAVWPTMVDAGCGRFVITSSATGLCGRVEGANYGAAKGGLIGLCNVLALEGEAKGILANAIMPVASTRLGKVPEDSDTTAEAGAARARALGDTQLA